MTYELVPYKFFLNWRQVSELCTTSKKAVHKDKVCTYVSCWGKQSVHSLLQPVEAELSQYLVVVIIEYSAHLVSDNYFNLICTRTCLNYARRSILGFIEIPTRTS